MANLRKVSPDAELSKGIWVTYYEDIEARVARINNPEYLEKLRKLSQPYMSDIQAGRFPDADMEALVMEAAAETILVDWRGMQDDEDKDVEYSPEQALAYLREYPDFYNFVMRIANSAEMYRKQDEAKTAKN